MAGGKEPQDRKIDGHDIRALIVGEAGVKTPYKVFYYYDGVQLQAVRSGAWKLFLPLENFRNHPFFSKKKKDSKVPLLFNVEEDISSSHNVAAQHPEIIARLTRLAEAGRADLGDMGRRGAGQREIGKMDHPTPRLLGDK
ncbi:MAG: hypothetical protein L3J39_00650 [Verrucomicrobiales bacterium]|nr:hypothetical protein [Verrucomicrobiales bacterium]